MVNQDNIQPIFDFVVDLIRTKNQKELNYIQKILLLESLTNPHKTYKVIAEEQRYSEQYITHTIAPKMWNILSDICKEKVNKYNCYQQLVALIERQQHIQQSKANLNREPTQLTYPSGAVPLGSPFYVNRFPLENRCYQEITRPGSLIRIKSPRYMGKTSLLKRIINKAENLNDKIIEIDFNSIDSEILKSTSKFLWWFCSNATRQLGLVNRRDDYWDEDSGYLICCTTYFQDYLFQNINTGLLIALDEVNQLFEYPNLCRDFFALLRYWHEKTKFNSCWEKLKIVMVNSTDCYVNLDLNKSPFNVGINIELPPFTANQVDNLALEHGIHLSSSELSELMVALGGYPYLVRVILYHSVVNQIPVMELLKNSAMIANIFRQYLSELLEYLHKYENLSRIFKQVLKSKSPISVEPISAFKLNSLGLINIQDNRALISCQLYQTYFNDWI